MTEHFLRHKSGGGRVYDEAEVSADSYFSRGSEARGLADIQNARIENSSVTDSFVYGGKIVASTVFGAIVTGNVRIENSTIACDKVAGDVRIINSKILDESRILNKARIENCSFRNLTVGGAAILKNWSNELFDGCHGRIFSGVWERPPRIVRFDDLETTITEADGGKAFVGCISKPITRWLKIGDRYGAAMGWNPQQVKALRNLFESWLEEYV